MSTNRGGNLGDEEGEGVRAHSKRRRLGGFEFVVSIDEAPTSGSWIALNFSNGSLSIQSDRSLDDDADELIKMIEQARSDVRFLRGYKFRLHPIEASTPVPSITPSPRETRRTNTVGGEQKPGFQSHAPGLDRYEDNGRGKGTGSPREPSNLLQQYDTTRGQSRGSSYNDQQGGNGGYDQRLPRSEARHAQLYDRQPSRSASRGSYQAPDLQPRGTQSRPTRTPFPPSQQRGQNTSIGPPPLPATRHKGTLTAHNDPLGKVITEEDLQDWNEGSNFCPGCQQRGHELVDCIKWSNQYDKPGCIRCNSIRHDPDVCPRIQRASVEECIEWFVIKSAGKPGNRSMHHSWDRYAKEARPLDAYPLSRAFLKRIENSTGDNNEWPCRAKHLWQWWNYNHPSPFKDSDLDTKKKIIEADLHESYKMRSVRTREFEQSKRKRDDQQYHGVKGHDHDESRDIKMEDSKGDHKQGTNRSMDDMGFADDDENAVQSAPVPDVPRASSHLAPAYTSGTLRHSAGGDAEDEVDLDAREWIPSTPMGYRLAKPYNSRTRRHDAEAGAQDRAVLGIGGYSEAPVPTPRPPTAISPLGERFLAERNARTLQHDVRRNAQDHAAFGTGGYTKRPEKPGR